MWKQQKLEVFPPISQQNSGLWIWLHCWWAWDYVKDRALRNTLSSTFSFQNCVMSCWLTWPYPHYSFINKNKHKPFPHWLLFCLLSVKIVVSHFGVLYFNVFCHLSFTPQFLTCRKRLWYTDGTHTYQCSRLWELWYGYCNVFQTSLYKMGFQLVCC